jgi:glutamate/tyrosine decarboxylase-like PLP-dependent enzyme
MHAFIQFKVENLAQSISSLNYYVDSKLEHYSRFTLVSSTAIAVVALGVFAKFCQTRWGETSREQAGRLALMIPYVKKKFIADIHQQLTHFQDSVKKKWEVFGDLQTTIPENGLDVKSLLALIKSYSQPTCSALKDKHVSGTIYSKSLDQGYADTKQAEFIEQNTFENDALYFDYLSKKVGYVCSIAFQQANLWNSLHSDEFPIGACMDYQVVRMVASMFGGSPNEIMGFVTSGGTESLMLAVRALREWGSDQRGHQPGEGVIIASKNVHAAIMKAGKAYQVEVELIDVDHTGKIDLQQLDKSVKKHGNKVIGIIGNAPNYVTGITDPIEKMAEIAKKNGCGMHVDCCLGGFIAGGISEQAQSYLKISGVTSLSVDTHKNGLAPKGSSVLVTKELGEKNLAAYSIYSIPEWSGGPYGTPKDAGSQSCLPSFYALLTMLAIGTAGYQKIAEAIHQTACDLAGVISEFNGKLSLIVKPELNVVTFQIDEKWGLQKGATYAFAGEMAQNGFILNTLRDDRVHFCVTLRLVSDPVAIKKFKTAVEKSLKAVENLNKKFEQDGQKFPGDAGMYCALEAAMTPIKEELSTEKFFENLLLGRQGARAAVTAYFLAQLNPYTN